MYSVSGQGSAYDWALSPVRGDSVPRVSVDRQTLLFSSPVRNWEPVEAQQRREPHVSAARAPNQEYVLADVFIIPCPRLKH
jgi:hypothetical protein